MKSLTEKFASLDISGLDGPRDLFWNGIRIVSADEMRQGKVNININNMREIVWDLFETNFRLELLALDRCIIRRENMTIGAVADRDELLLACFPGECLINANFPSDRSGLAAEEVSDRMEFVDAFRVVASSWPGLAAAQLVTLRAYKQIAPGIKISTPAMCEAVERILYPFYCQTFFNYFARAPTIPHTWPTYMVV